MHGPFATRIYVDAGQLGSIDDEFLNQFLKEKKAKVREYHKQLLVDRTRKPKSSLFANIERIDNGLRLTLTDEPVKPYKSAQLRFENNSIYFYESGTAMFSTEVMITFQKGLEIALLRELEEFAKNFVLDNFGTQLLSFSNMFSEIISSKKLRLVPGIAVDSCKAGHLGWLHTVFYFENEQLFADKPTEALGQLKDDALKDLSGLLEQIPEDMSPLVDRYVFYGWARSLILTKGNIERSEIVRLVELLEIYQYFTFGLYQLDTFLIKEMYELDLRSHKPNLRFNIDGVENIDELNASELNDIRAMIQRLDNVRSSTIRYLEQFRYSSNVVLISGQRPLIQRLEDQWGLEHIERGIRNKLDLLDRELSSEEQALIAKENSLIVQKQNQNIKQQEFFLEEQGYLSKLILMFTVITLAGVISQLIVLSPLNETFPEKTHDFVSSQLFVVLLASGALIAFVLILFRRFASKLKARAHKQKSKTT